MSVPSTAPAAAAVPVRAGRGLLLHCGGPLQSWGHHSHFNQRDTAAFPTRSGIIGLLAAALGRGRGEPIDDLAQLRITIRVDRPGVLLRDLHTVGGGLPASETVTTAQGKKRSGDTTTLLSHRYYLADAAFTVAVTPASDTPGQAELLQECATALRAPRWPLYLGRRACPPAGPLLLGVFDDALHHLVRLPLAASAPRAGSPTGVVEFVADQPLNRLPLPDSTRASDPADAAQPAARINDQPATFHPRLRTYRARPLYRRTFTPLPDQWGGLGVDYLACVAAYLDQALPAREGNPG
ncbi:type I-E CRISPR-associated protein Cas5/CasD [Streptomyces sp. BK340]|uniref:type I-E CRISPR-associated protein Cas5/CasD n=1 Tax=Streptomyces sp. BK340 TaxID=2572903 RepID=UPI0011A20259|nr:type I-E CRISPR-associated protein Cas5/CasD [Streptomyces sp. BK340]TVZ90485.1 CRISPR-associated Cas5e family protein [Streptomyces sp. BK340]